MRAGEPQQKDKTEATVRLCRSLIDSLGTRFEGLDKLQARTDECVERWSERSALRPRGAYGELGERACAPARAAVPGGQTPHKCVESRQ